MRGRRGASRWWGRTVPVGAPLEESGGRDAVVLLRMDERAATDAAFVKTGHPVPWG